MIQDNRCFLPHMKHMGHVSGRHCPDGPAEVDAAANAPAPAPYRLPSGTRGDPPPVPPPVPSSVCGIDLAENSYYGFAANLTMDYGAASEMEWSVWQGLGNEPGSRVFHLPSDELLMFWARAKIGLPNTGPEPAEPAVLPPAPIPHFADSCLGDCGKAGHCCTGNTSGCQMASCVMGCAMGNYSSAVADCKSQCAAAKGTCRYNITGTNPPWGLDLCGSCPEGCPGCDDGKACDDGCTFAFNHPRPPSQYDFAL
jgi:hypothetical protein